MKFSHDLPASLRWKIALNIRYQKDQHCKQHKNFDDIIQEKMEKIQKKGQGVHDACSTMYSLNNQEGKS